MKGPPSAANKLDGPFTCTTLRLRRALEELGGRALPQEDDRDQADQPDEDPVKPRGAAAAARHGRANRQIDGLYPEEHGRYDPRPRLAGLAHHGHPDPQPDADQAEDGGYAERHVVTAVDLGCRQLVIVIHNGGSDRVAVQEYDD